ncbi:MAG: AAA family ATPase [SAR324 cluster bacterium]|nr:AAA family ATPase [SAR324 cluster bacterium]
MQNTLQSLPGKSVVDLFDYSSDQSMKQAAPLADRMRPRTLEEFVGQSRILAPGRLLRRAIQADQISSLIFFGPPGTGKTTLARIIANTTKSRFIAINAVLAGIKEIRDSIEQAQTIRKQYQQRTILFIDEVHRFNKAQQDALLPHVENGIIILIGATTENPYFEVNKALVSRSRIFQLESLTAEDLRAILIQAIQDKERGFGQKSIQIEDNALNHLANISNGDARVALNALELAVVTTPPVEGVIHIDLGVAEESIQQRAVLYDKDGDAHFDTISAFIKSMRGSDPDASLYWMAKMVYAGEDPRFIFRRMLIFASEDVGLADPKALSVIVSALQAFDCVGMPEGRFHLSQACLYLATAPKSNSTMAFFDALGVVSRESRQEVPNHLKDGSRDQEGLGHGKNYLYPHAYQDHWVAQQYLPGSLQGRLFYQPGTLGFEATLSQNVNHQRELQIAAFLENMNQSEQATSQDYWTERTFNHSSESLLAIKNRLFDWFPDLPQALCLNVNAGDGLFLREIFQRTHEGSLFATVQFEQEKQILNTMFERQKFWHELTLLVMSVEEFPDKIKKSLPNVLFDVITGKNFFQKILNKSQSIEHLLELLNPEGSLLFAESVPSLGQRLSELLPPESIPQSLSSSVHEAEEWLYTNHPDPKFQWNPDSMGTLLSNLPLKHYKLHVEKFTTPLYISSKRLEHWFESGSNPESPTYRDALLRMFDLSAVEQFRKIFEKHLTGKKVNWQSTILFFQAIKN